MYGSHDRADSEEFCDYKLKVWSAPVEQPGNWVCHGDAFHTKPDEDHVSDVDWTQNCLYAPDVVENNGKYYLYAYILNAKGCIGVSDKPEGPFKLHSQYKYNIPNHYDNGTFIDPGVLVDDDGRVYVYCGFQGSYMCEVDAGNMYEVLDGTYQEDIIPVTDGEDGFFEACSPRKVGDTYYMIYSPAIGSRLDYATSKSPTGPFEHRGTIVDNGIDYPGGNNHGSICCINGQWYIFYHRMTNGTIMSRRGCVERIEILPDGTIPQVEMTSLGFEESLNPYQITAADTACVLKGGSFITELNSFERVITNITNGCVMGWKYFDFGEDYTKGTLEMQLKVIPRGCSGKLHVWIDDPENGKEIGTVAFDMGSSVISGRLDMVTGRHAIYLVADMRYTGWAKENWENRPLLDIVSFVIRK